MSHDMIRFVDDDTTLPKPKTKAMEAIAEVASDVLSVKTKPAPRAKVPRKAKR